ncbi:MAG: hypothetical protein LAN64_02505 [Acidobacteriia bacterium]|nr:hypothetical protein [Terriglobia bacterium]
MMAESLQEIVAARRRWKMIAMALLIALVGSLAVNARADLPFPERVRARTVEAQEIVLKDGEGHVRARFSVQGEAARLIIFDAKGKAVAELPERARMKELGQ